MKNITFNIPTSADFEAGYSLGFNHGMSVAKENPDNLTQAEVQLLTSVLAYFLSEVNDELPVMKNEVKKLWEKCNKDDPSTKVYFDNFSATLKFYRSVKKQQNKMCEIQRKLKKMKNG